MIKHSFSVEFGVWSVELKKTKDGNSDKQTALIKSKRFAIRIVNLYRYLCEEKKEYVMSRQILRCGTAVGANLAESTTAISRKDFLSKIYIAVKECSETQYWLELLRDTDYITEEMFVSIQNDCEELRKMLSSSTKTMKEEL